MRALGVAELLWAWERAYAQRPAERALTLVAAATSDEGLDPRALAIGERDARLLTLREKTFGPVLSSVTRCEACGETMELTLGTDDVRAHPAAGGGTGLLQVAGFQVAWRLPTCGDVAALGPEEGADAARARLEDACIVRAWREDEVIAPRDLPPEVRAALAEAVAEADPQADVEVAMACPACSHANLVPFDVATFFWDELTAWAQRTLREVHALASAYGWSERDVLSLSPFRRQLYLEMLGE